MNYTTYIDNKKMIEWGLLYQEAALLDWFCRLHQWAETINYNGGIYYFASRNKAIEENPMITSVSDTMYRYYKKLKEKGLIELIKVENRDYIQLTSKAKQWGRFIRDSEINPNELGNESKNNSEINPTYYINNNNNINKDKEEAFPELFKEVESLPIVILNYLNENKKSKIPFKPTRSNLSTIKTRLKEGFVLDDFKKVVDHKVKTWDSDKMRPYVRPDTLFGNKFNSYIVEADDFNKKNTGSDNFINKEFDINNVPFIKR